ncbi:MAG: uncharacterized protein QOJ12_2703 [Thermoleophilales bacterium]|jgi:predicted TIM-barrel fold metal-dependent hydrolase|nr:uncharacterized protein [Thermoleophilales bacterium]
MEGGGSVPGVEGADGDRAAVLVDCDVHPTFKHGLRDLAPYLSVAWQARLGVAGDGGRDMFGGVRESTIELPKSPFFTPSPGAFRKDAYPPAGGPPGSDPRYLAEHHLDAWGVDRALLLGQPALTLGAHPNPDVASTIASAYNDWLEETWLEADPRYRGALAVAPQDVSRAVAEIERVADRHAGFVAVFVPLTTHMLGDLHFHPIYEAAERHGLPITVHISGVEGTFQTSPTLGGGVPATYFEYKTMVTTTYQANLASLVVRGVFERFPALRVVMVECGVAWLVELLWRLDTNWKALRDEAPWVRQAPSEYIFERVRFTSQPFVEPPTRKQLLDFCEMVRIEDILLFASDYPHYDFDNPLRVLNSLPERSRSAVRGGNALEVFGPRMAAPGRDRVGA